MRDLFFRSKVISEFKISKKGGVNLCSIVHFVQCTCRHFDSSLFCARQHIFGTFFFATNPKILKNKILGCSFL